MDSFTKFSLMISLCTSLSYAFLGPPYDYKVFDVWTLNSAICGNGKHQSPIDLGPKSKTISGFPLEFNNYTVTIYNGAVMNDGHTVRIAGNWGKTIPSVTGSLVKNEQYLLDDVHLHWSEKNNSGTEHGIHGKRHACEVHLVHHNSKYGNVFDALNKTDGLLVIGLLFKISNNAPNTGLQAMSDFAETVREVGTKSKGNFDLGSFGIESIKSFYTYAGSITTPPCLESVRWVISNEILATNTDIMKVIRSAKLNDDDKSNVRPIQSINGHEIIFFKK